MKPSTIYHREKRYSLILALWLLFPLGVSANSDSDYKTGADFAKQLSGQGESTLKNAKPNELLSNYTESPKEKDFYGGVTANDANNIVIEGTNALSQSDAGKTVTESILNNPKDPISLDAPFIQAGQEIEEKADSIVGKTGPKCKPQTLTKSEFTRHTCERDTQVLKTCERPTQVGGYYATKGEDKYSRILGDQIYWWGVNGNEIYGYFIAPFAGSIYSASLYSWAFNLNYGNMVNNVSVFGDTVIYGIFDSGLKNVRVQNNQMTQGQRVDVVVRVNNSYGNRQGQAVETVLSQLRYPGDLFFYIDITGNEKIQYWVPTTSVAPECAVAQEAGAVLVNTVCSEAGGERWVVVDGQGYPVWAACWRFTDTYRLQDTDPGSCLVYASNSACTVANRGCAFGDESGNCLRESVVYSCEQRTSGTVMMCGGQMYCQDGECDRLQNGISSNGFQKAVSALAAVAAAGKDVAELNGVNVRAFTGNARFCKKAAAGFNNCCKDSGWGQDIGLSSCSSEEKALGKAKENKLTISIGEFCSKKVLGVCLERKRSYCQFDSKLAQIVQEQGRAWQLGIGFGSAESPDCRGITVNELQSIKFDNLNFSNFFDDLMNNQTIPSNDALLNKVKEQINSQIKQ